MTGRPFSDIRILDLSRVLAGPWATQMLADMGADVIKVEKPGGGDDTRRWGPDYVTDADGRDALSAYFIAANRGKRSASIDIRTAEGQALIRKLARSSDVLVENYKVGGLSKYGLDYDSLKAVNPRLVYCSITGFGQSGPYAARPGYDFVIQGMGGLMGITGPAASDGGKPTKAGVALADIITGLYAANAIGAALRHRDRTGEGQHIDIALMDSMVAVLANQALGYLVGGTEGARLGNAHPNIVPYQSFETRDSDITIAVGNDNQFRQLCALLGLAELAEDERFATNDRRVKNRDALIPLLSARLGTETSDHWVNALNRAGVPGGRINSISEVFADPQVVHRGMQVAMRHERLGDIPGLANPVRFSRTPVAYDLPPPLEGEHTQAVIAELSEDP